MTIYVDNDHRCHASPGEGLRGVETEFFDGKCRAYIEGYCCEVAETGIAFYPWVDYAQLESAQRGYEEAMAALAQLQAENQDMTAALAVLGVTGDE